MRQLWKETWCCKALRGKFLNVATYTYNGYNFNYAPSYNSFATLYKEVLL